MNFNNSQSEIILKYLAENFRGSLRSLRSTCDLLKQCSINEDKIVSEICASNPAYERLIQQIFTNVSKVPSEFFKRDYSTEKCVPPVKPKESIYFDFSRQRKFEANKSTPIPNNQCWLLFEHGIRQEKVCYTEGYLIFKWRYKGRDFNPKSCFKVVVSKTNSLIKPFGLKFEPSGTEKNVWQLRGLETTPHTFNILEAQRLLREAAKAAKNKPAVWDKAHKSILMAFELDSTSLGIAFSIVKLMKRAGDSTISAEILRKNYRLLRKHEIIYADALDAIGRCEILHNADIGGQLRKYRSMLDQIRDHRRQIQNAPQWLTAHDDNEVHVDKLIQHIRRIKANYADAKSICNADDFKFLYESADIQKAKRTVINNIIKHYQVDQITREGLEIEFKNCMAELILTKIDCSYLERPSSFAHFCKKTIHSKLLDRILRDRYGLSYSQYILVRRKRKIENALYQKLGKKPTDKQTATAMKISIDRFFEIKQWESELKVRSPGEGWNCNEFDAHGK